MVFRPCRGTFRTLLFGVSCLVLVRFSESLSPIAVKAGIILAGDNASMYSMYHVRPALERGFAKALLMFNVKYTPVFITYHDSCFQSDALGQAVELSLLQNVDVLVGPACSEDLVIIGQLSTYFQIPALTGAGELVDSTAEFPYLIRFSFNTYSLWRIFVVMMQFYDWRSIVIIRDCCDYPKNVTIGVSMKQGPDPPSNETSVKVVFPSPVFSAIGSVLQNGMEEPPDGSDSPQETVFLTVSHWDRQVEKGSSVFPTAAFKKGFINILGDEHIQPYEYHFPSGSINSSEQIKGYLTEASRFGRIYVLSMESLLLRKFMLEANRLGMCEGEYAFVALDLYQNDIIKSGKNGWKQNDEFDNEAKHAYASLFILTLMDKTQLPAYQQFEKDVRLQAARDYGPDNHVDINWAFHDSVIMFASTANLTVQEGKNVSKEFILPLTQRFWGVTWEGGASGSVYIDPFGDRSDDHSLLHMKDEQSGEFHVIANYYGYRKMYEEVANISWPGQSKKPPLNKPFCGYMHENPDCRAKAQPITEITVGVALGVLVILAVVGALVYRKIKEEASLSSMDWLAQWSEVSFGDTTGNEKSVKTLRTMSDGTVAGKKKVDHDKKTQVTGGSRTSGGMRSQQVTFRGNLISLRNCERSRIELTAELRNELKIVRIISHENLLRFVGAILGPDKTAVLYEYCSKGNLQNLLTNDNIKLDDLFKNSLLNDIVKVQMLVRELCPNCCINDTHCSRFVLKVGDYGLPTFFETMKPLKPDNEYYTHLLWKAPEVNPNLGTPEGDVYSFGIILQEVVLREEPFAMHQLSAEEIVKKVNKNAEPPFRPTIKGEVAPPELLTLMYRCWTQIPTDRPRFQEVRSVMKQISKNDDQQGNIIDILISRMEAYAQNLENLVDEKTQAFLEEKRKSDELLSQVLPKAVAESLKKGEPVHPESYESVTIYFSDIQGFTSMSSESSPMQIVDFLNDLYTCFDGIIMKHDVYKVETIGDSYMCVSGLPLRNGLQHAAHIARMALALLGSVKTFRIRHRPDEQLKLRIGTHSGSCVAGVVGLTMPRYCLFGDTVNTASRMESTGEALKIQISSFTKTILDTFDSFDMEDRGEIAVKGKGQVKTYWLLRERNQ